MSNGTLGDPRTPGAPVAAKVSDFQRIENRLNEVIDMLRGVVSTATTVKSKLIGCEPSDEAEKVATPAPSSFIGRVNCSIDCAQDLLRSANLTLNELNGEI